MKTAYDAQNLMDAQLVCDLLQSAGIPARVSGAGLLGAAGELPAIGVVQVLVPEGSPAKKLDDLASKTLIVTTGTTADIWLTRNHPDWKVLKFEKNTESLQALAQGRGDGPGAQAVGCDGEHGERWRGRLAARQLGSAGADGSRRAGRGTGHGAGARRADRGREHQDAALFRR